MNKSTLGDVTFVGIRLQAGDAGAVEKLLGWMGGDASAIDPGQIDAQLHEAQMLQADEHVLMALRCGKDTTCFTTKRVFFMDHQRSLLSKKMEYKSVPWSSVLAFEVESAGSFDADAEATLWWALPRSQL